MTHWEGRLVLPIGRHSLQHTWVPKWPSGRLIDHGGNPHTLADGVLTATTTVSRGMDALKAWYPHVMAANFDEFGLKQENITLNDYLVVVADRGLRDKQVRLNGLVQAVRFGDWSFHREAARQTSDA
ncbi:MAG TPA: hypothetical protein VG815_18000 [Chloroflexota bacterium]|nr:hypothetical protein [Chloroflexota bacterium]